MSEQLLRIKHYIGQGESGRELAEERQGDGPMEIDRSTFVPTAYMRFQVKHEANENADKEAVARKAKPAS
jgi:hypothetical protein